MRSPLQQIHFVRENRFFIAEKRDQDTQSDRGLSYRVRDHKNREDLPVDVLQVVREGSPDTVTVQPLSIDTEPADYANLFGAHIQRSGMIATFDLRAVPPLPFDIVVVNPAKEARDHVKPKDQPKLR